MTTADLPITEPITEPSPLATFAKKTRLQSLDVFRGITIAGMLLVNNPGPGEPYAPLDHVPWDGWTPTDLVFPFFLFIVGVAIPFSLARRKSDPNQSRGALLGQIWLRALSLVMLGELLHAMPGLWRPLPDGLITLKILHVLTYFIIYGGILVLLIPWRWKRVSTWAPPIIAVAFTLLMLGIFYANRHAVGAGIDIKQLGRGVYRPDQFRIPGVLQRIGICYGVAASIALFAGWRTVLISAIILMAGYAALMFKAPYPGHATGSLTMKDNLARSIDVAVFDRYAPDANGKMVAVQKHTYGPYPDNEGLLSTLPSIATSLLGILAGLWLMSSREPIERCAGLLAMAVPVTILGCCLDSWLMPINKNLWSPSFVVFTAGLAMLGLGFLFWMIDVRGRRWWAIPFTIFGVNAIAAYAAQSLVPHVMGMFRVRDPASDKGEMISSLSYLEHQAVNGLHHFNTWLQAHVHFLPPIDGPGNTSLIGSMVFILCCFVLMAILYAFKIFVKV